MNIKYFNGVQELTQVQGYPNAQFFAAGGIKSKANWYDGFERLMGRASDGRLLPVERAIAYKSAPSKHVCNANPFSTRLDKNHKGSLAQQILPQDTIQTQMGLGAFESRKRGML